MQNSPSPLPRRFHTLLPLAADLLSTYQCQLTLTWPCINMQIAQTHTCARWRTDTLGQMAFVWIKSSNGMQQHKVSHLLSELVLALPRGTAGVCVTLGQLCLDISFGKGPALPRSFPAPWGWQRWDGAPSSTVKSSQAWQLQPSAREQPLPKHLLSPHQHSHSGSFYSAGGGITISQQHSFTSVFLTRLPRTQWLSPPQFNFFFLFFVGLYCKQISMLPFVLRRFSYWKTWEDFRKSALKRN